MNPILNTTDISGMNVTRLRQELTRRGLPSHGLKPTLAERLQQAMKNPLLAQQLASPVMLGEMERMLFAGDVESIRLWLDAGVDANIATEEGGWTLLFMACKEGQEVVQVRTTRPSLCAASLTWPFDLRLESFVSSLLSST
jgi:hypothetical protein